VFVLYFAHCLLKHRSVGSLQLLLFLCHLRTSRISQAMTSFLAVRCQPTLCHTLNGKKKGIKCFCQEMMPTSQYR